MDKVTNQLKQFRVDAILGKKKHYNAAVRKKRYYKITSTVQIILNAITGTTLLTLVLGKGNNVAEILALIFSIITTVLASFQKTLDFENQSQGNNKAGDMYLEIAKSTNLALCKITDGALTQEEILKFADNTCEVLAKANKYGSQFPTNRMDYKKAASGIKDGEECYTQEDLSLWE